MTTKLLSNRAVQAVTAILLAQLIGYYALSRREVVLESKPLSTFPKVVGHWTMQQDSPLSEAVEEKLKADDTLYRIYASRAMNSMASLYVAYFRSQRAGQSPHSPKNCLPGSGWVPVSAGTIEVKVSEKAAPITVNRYIVARGDDRTLVLYWYQSRGEVAANEYMAKLQLVADALRYNRSDTSLVRVVVPIERGEGAKQKAERIAVDFVRAVYPPLNSILPS